MKNLSGIFKSKIYPLFVFLFLLAAVAFWKSAAPVESARQSGETSPLENYDIRADKSETTREALKKFTAEATANAATTSNARNDLRQAIEAAEKTKNLRLEFNETGKTPELIFAAAANEAKFLTEPSREKRVDILRAFLNENSALLGLDEAQISALETTADYTNPSGVLSFVNLAQKIGGVPVFGGEIKAGFTKRGEIFRVVNNLAPALDYQNPNADFGSAETAVSNAAKFINANELVLNRNEALSNDLKITFERGQFADDITAEKIYFPVRFGAARAAWRVLFWTKTEAFYIVVDALDGTLLWRKNITENQTLPATYNVYGNQTSMMKTADSPTAFTPGCENPNDCPTPPIINRQTFTIVGNETPYAFNNLGWIPDAGLPVRTPADPNVTDGNNVEAGLDIVSPNGVDAPVSGDPFRVFNFNYNPFPGNPPPGEEPTLPEYRKGAVTNVFYTVNRWHDEMYLLGFNEQAGNFQHFNFGRGGSENDRVSAEVQDSSGTNSIGFSTPADGARPRLQTFILTGTTPNRDGALDAQTVVHELSHGVSSRLFGTNGLASNMSRALGEGWSDFYALALLSEPSDNLCGKYAIGGYFILGAVPDHAAYYYGIRRFPTARIQCTGPNGKPHSPLTFRHANANCNNDINAVGAYARGQIGSNVCDQVHNLSEIWSAALWEVRGVLIDRHGATEGNRRVLQYVTDAMKISPLNPTFLQERDAIIAAAFASDPSDVGSIREGFRRRGMGFSASVQNAGTGTNNTIVTEAFDNPNIRIVDPFTVSDSVGDGDGFPEPGENVLLGITLTNQTGQAVTNVFVNVNNGANFSAGTINSGQTVTVQIPYQIPNISCSSDTHQVVIRGGSSLGVLQPVTKQFRIGVAPLPVEFTNSAPINLPNGQPTTTSGAASPYPSSITVSGLSGIMAIKVRLNGFHYEFEDDADLLLVGPGGQKFILMSDVGGGTDQTTPITFTIADAGENFLPDVAAILNGQIYKPANHLGNTDSFPPPASGAPYETAAPSGSATFASVFGSNGANLNGTWSLYAVDDAEGDVGRIDGGWTLMFESAYVSLCSPASRARADFDGDRRTDLSVFRPSEGNWYLNRSTLGFTVFNWGLSGDEIVPGDYDGDGKADPAIRRGGDWYVWKSSLNTYSVTNWGLASDIAVSGDYDGDFKSDYAVFRPSEGIWYVLRSVDGGNIIFNWGVSGDKPIAGDFDGDGKTDFAVYRNGVWYINASTAGVRIVSFGLSSDVPAAADYDGDGKDDISVFRPSNGVWYVLNSMNGNIQYVQFGLSGDIPVPGDYDGDFRSDFAVYRSGVWYLLRSSSGFTAAQFGSADDKPIPKAYVP